MSPTSWRVPLQTEPGVDDVALAASRVATGLLAGVYVAFLVAVMPALRGASDETFVAVMTRINVVIVNPAFLVLFVGSPVLTGAVLFWSRSPLVVAASALALAALVITVVANLPLNDALAARGSRSAYENPWLAWHAARTACALLCFGLLSLVHSGCSARARPREASATNDTRRHTGCPHQSQHSVSGPGQPAPPPSSTIRSTSTSSRKAVS
jgi:uncharacterized membrane protein